MTQLFRALFCLLVLLGGTLILDRHAPSAETSGKVNNPPEPLYYTIQIGSFSDEAEAMEWYNLLREQLPADLRKFLRIESIPPFLTVRVGKAEDRQEIIPLFAEIQQITSRPSAIIHGYYRPLRITKLYDPTAPPAGPAAAPPKDQRQPPARPAPTVEKTPKTKPEAKASPPPQGSEEEPLDTPPEATGATRTKPSRRAAKAPPPEKAPPPVKIPDATLKQMIIDKYLADQSSSKSGQEAIIKRSQSFPENPSCTTATCHATVKADTISHYPVKTGRCLACHHQVNEKHPEAAGADFQLVAKGGELCNKCHPKPSGKKYTHDPAAKGECLNCHAPHGGKNPFLLTVAADSQEKLCLTCHDQEITTGKFTHGPVGLGACSFCHDPHESDRQALLTNESQALCLECHTDIAKGVKESTSIHKVVQTEGCVSCHLPHASEYPYLLKQSGEEFCFSCHPAIKDKYGKARSKHAGIYLEKQCGTCHQPHYSAHEKLLNSKELNLCLGCHSEQSTVRSKAPKNIASELEKTFLHEPLAKGKCSVCHDPHGSGFLKLLTGPYPDTFYASYDPDLYDLCFTCHDKELLTSQSTETATSFRNGAQNLHYLHAAIPRKGRTCQTCHQSHASDGPKLINQMGLSFGEWQMSISFTSTANGGSCMPGCHRKMEYDRDHAAANSVKETEFGDYHVEYNSVK